MSKNPAEPTYSETYRAISVTFDDIETRDARMRKVLDTARRIASSGVTVLILGETGSGKNLIAQAIHNASPRIDHPFMSVNCSAMAESLLESTLFGHERGSFTGAERSRKGVFEAADRGTLFLDEIGDMSGAAQAKILHALEYGQFQPVGSETTRHADVRVIAASNKNLEDGVRDGSFRRDLYYRLAEVTLDVPPLRDRRGDIPLLVEVLVRDCNRKFKRSFTGVGAKVMNLLRTHDWPGNVRELRAVIRRACSIAEGPKIRPEDISLGHALERTAEPAPGAAEPANPAAAADPPALSLAAMEKQHIARVLELTGWNKKRAAAKLEISRPTLDRKIRGYGLVKPESESTNGP